jgi:hypothetical protein
MPENVHVQLIDDCYNCFNDGVTKIGKHIILCLFRKKLYILDFILVYEDRRATTIDELMISLPPSVNNEENDRLALALQKQKDRHRLFKRRFLGNLSKLGLLMETVCLNEYFLFNRK